MKKLFQVVSTRADGNLSFQWGQKDEVLAHRHRFFQKNNLSSSSIVVMKTLNKDIVTVVSHDDAGKGVNDFSSAVQTDAILTREKDLFLFLLTADCLPVTIYDPVTEVIALAHLSRKSTSLHLLEKVIRTCQTKYGCHLKNLQVFLGPAIKKESYLFDFLDEELKDNDWKPFITQLPNQKYAIDLTSYNIYQLTNIGIVHQNIFIDPTDTATSSQYFSHYHSLKNSELEARFATIVGMT